MTNMAAKLTDQHLEQIEQYLTGKYPALKGVRSKQSSRDIGMDIHERIVRVEEELKGQREIIRDMMIFMEKRFEQVDKRFEQVDRRFEEMRMDMDRRFEQVDKRFGLVDKRFEEMRTDMESRFRMMMWFTGAGLTLVTTVIAVITVVVR